MNSKPETCSSCCGCKFLYGDGSGYSNYTWMETYIRCALDKNPALRGDVEARYDWNKENDQCPETMNGRCDSYSPGSYIELDPDREGVPYEYRSGWDPYDFDDEEQYLAIASADSWGEVPPFSEYASATRNNQRIERTSLPTQEPTP